MCVFKKKCYKFRLSYCIECVIQYIIFPLSALIFELQLNNEDICNVIINVSVSY